MAGELLLTSPLEECAFIRPRELAAMQAAGMASVRDLLFMLPAGMRTAACLTVMIPCHPGRPSA